MLSGQALVDKAREVATAAHAGQFRNDGITPYITHPEWIAEQLDGAEAKATAYLHDVIEDTNITKDDLLKIFPPLVVEYVDILTHKNNESYAKYLSRIEKSGFTPTLVKLWDIVHNYQNSHPKDFKRQTKYGLAYYILTGKFIEDYYELRKS